MRPNNSDENFLVPVPHLPYSSDLALSNFLFFGHIKTSRAGRVLNDVDELLEMPIEFLTKIQPLELQLVFHR
jgi:hypothetical protein